MFAPILILALNMGVTGAAIATVIGNMVAYIIYICIYSCDNSKRDFRPYSCVLQQCGSGRHGVAMKINTVAVYVQLGLGTGVQPLIGYNYGAVIVSYAVCIADIRKMKWNSDIMMTGWDY